MTEIFKDDDMKEKIDDVLFTVKVWTLFFVPPLMLGFLYVTRFECIRQLISMMSGISF